MGELDQNLQPDLRVKSHELVKIKARIKEYEDLSRPRSQYATAMELRAASELKWALSLLEEVDK